MKKEVSTFFAILVTGIIAVIGFSIFYSYQYIWYPEEVYTLNEGVKIKGPQQTVLEFYKCYVSERHKAGPLKAAEECGGVESNFKEDILNQIEEGLSYDPILLAQDSPGADNIQVEQTTPEDGKVVVIITFDPIWPGHKIKTYLQKSGGMWLISDIKDISGE